MAKNKKAKTAKNYPNQIARLEATVTQRNREIEALRKEMTWLTKERDELRARIDGAAAAVGELMGGEVAAS